MLRDPGAHSVRLLFEMIVGFFRIGWRETRWLCSFTFRDLSRLCAQ